MKKVVIAGSAIVLLVVGVLAYFLMSGSSSDNIPTDDGLSGVVKEQERQPIAVLWRPNADDMNIYGPECYKDGRGNDTLFSGMPEANVDCFVFVQGGDDLINFTQRTDDVFIGIGARDPSRQSVEVGTGDVYLELKGDHNLTLSSRGEKNIVLAIPDLAVEDISFDQSGVNLTVITPRGKIFLVNQLKGRGDSGPVSEIVLSGRRVLENDQIRVRSVVGQGTPDNDDILDTDGDDVIYPGSGDDRITLRGGENRVHYEAGNDTIFSNGASENPKNTLFLPFNREDVGFETDQARRDLLLLTPNGETVRLALQIFYSEGDKRVPIQEVVFTDGPVSEGQLRFLLEVAEQAAGSVDRGARENIRQ